MNFIDKLIARIESINSHVCVGLDSRYDLIPDEFKNGKSVSNAIFEFNKKIISATHHVAVTYKTTLTFYRAFGLEGARGLLLTNEYLNSRLSGRDPRL